MTAIPPPPPPPHSPQRRQGTPATRDKAVPPPVTPGDDLLPELGRRFLTERADCCIARPSYRVLFPSGGDRVRPTELYLCGHHYRASTPGLLLSRVTVYDSANRLIA